MEFKDYETVLPNKKCVVCQSPIVVVVSVLVGKESQLPIVVVGEFVQPQHEVRCKNPECALLYSASLARELLTEAKA